MSAPEPGELELSLLALFAGWAMTGEVQRRVGLDQVRFNDGFVLQHVLHHPLPVSELAERMGVSQQAASKAVADLENRGILRREPAPADARVRLIHLTKFGREAVAASRRHRAELEAELEQRWGAERVADARALLAAVLDQFGGTESVRGRRVRIPE